MKNCLSIDEIMVDLRSRTRWDLRFIEEYQAFNNKSHEFESIFATFSYNHLLDEKATNVEDWDTYKNYIASDFTNLRYPPCHLYVERDEVTAIWFIPDILVIQGLAIEDKNLVMENMEKQLKELKLCKLEELTASEGDREVEEDLYLEYYRKQRFLELLLYKNIEKPNITSAKGEA
jgi:hypothetical protein